MKTLLQGLWVSACLLLGGNVAAQPEKICVSRPDGSIPEDCRSARGTTSFTTSADNRVNFRVNYRYSNEDNTSTLNLPGWYKAFWIFGDGNFAYFPTDSNAREQALSTLTFDNYVYARQGKFNAATYLTEVYSNDTKPPDTRTIIETPTDNTTNPTPELWRLDAGKRLDLLPNHQPRMMHKVVFATSWKKYIDARKLVFFYNGYRDSASGVVVASNAIINPSTVENEFPHYFDVSSETDPFFKKGNTATDYPTMASQYANYLEYNLEKLMRSQIPSHFEEVRVFPVFEINDLRNNDVLKAAQLAFEAQLWGTSDSIFSREKDDFFKGKFANSPIDLLERATYLEKVVTSHDPNDLNVVKIEDLGSNRFRVHFKLTVCNDGAIPETFIHLFIKSRLAGAVFNNFKALSPATSDIQFDATTDRWVAKYPNIYIPPTPYPYASSCNDFIFTMETDNNGVASLYNTRAADRPIEACVKFMSSTSSDECNRNNPIPKDFSVEKCQSDYILWLIFAGLGLLGLLALVFAWLKKGRR